MQAKEIVVSSHDLKRTFFVYANDIIDNMAVVIVWVRNSELTRVFCSEDLVCNVVCVNFTDLGFFIPRSR